MRSDGAGPHGQPHRLLPAHHGQLAFVHARRADQSAIAADGGVQRLSRRARPRVAQVRRRSAGESRTPVDDFSRRLRFPHQRPPEFPAGRNGFHRPQRRQTARRVESAGQGGDPSRGGALFLPRRPRSRALDGARGHRASAFLATATAAPLGRSHRQSGEAPC